MTQETDNSIAPVRAQIMRVLTFIRVPAIHAWANITTSDLRNDRFVNFAMRPHVVPQQTLHAV